MKFTGPTYRPPFEAASLLLQVTAGCSHNRCSFCTMYRDTPFQMESLEQIERDLAQAAAFVPHTKRVFLENGDPFVLPAERLKAIARLIHKHLQEADTIAMYASINNIKGKSDADLKQLRSMGINELNIGVESGLDSALAGLNKGYTAAEAQAELMRLKAAGIDYGANVIFGAAGPALRAENAVKTAELLNRTEPYLIFTGTIHADRGCPLYEHLQSGAFTENTVEEYLEEEELFLQHLELENCFYFGLHPSNIVPMSGPLSRDRDVLLQKLREVRSSLSASQLRSKPKRYGEGAVIL